MNISDIRNKTVKISPHSITVKNEERKTCGVVKNIKPYTELRPSEGMKYFKQLRQAGIWDKPELIKNFVICDGEPYYLYDLRPLQQYEKLLKQFKNADLFETDKKHCDERRQAAEKAAEFATVIPCYIV